LESEGSGNNEKRIKISNINGYIKESTVVYGINDTETERQEYSFLPNNNLTLDNINTLANSFEATGHHRDQTTELDISDAE
jgi:hypothetical protein